MNMCSVRQRPIPSAPNSRAFAASSGVSALARTRSRRASSAQPRIVSKFSSIAGGTSGTGADDHASRSAVDRELIALAQLDLAEPNGSGLQVDRERVAACHARLSHPARDDGGVRGHPAVCRQDAARVDQAVDVVGRRLPADEHDVDALSPALLGEVGVEHDGARGGAGRRVEPFRDDVDVGAGVDHRVQELVELTGVDTGDGLLARDEALLGHLDADPQRGLRGSLPRPGLEQEEPSLLDRELDVLHLPVVLLEAIERARELGVGVREELAHPLDRLGRADAGDDVLALCVDEELAVEAPLPRRRVAREADPGARRVALVPEHHLDDVDRGAEVVRDVVRPSVDPGARRFPGVEHRTRGAVQLLAGVRGEREPTSRS